MQSHFIVVSKEGDLYNAQEYLEKGLVSSVFNILLEREACHRGVKKSIAGEKPAYLDRAHQYGFSWEKNADIGFMSMDYQANFMHNLVKLYARDVVQKIGFPILEVSGSRMFDMSHPVVRAYAKLFGERLFHPPIRAKRMVMGYDCSYPQFNLAQGYHISYKQLPFAHFSVNECFRLEQSGECMLLYRGRQFNMPDLHPYFKNIDEAFQWYPRIEQQVIQVFADARREYVLSMAVSSQQYWDKYKEQIKDIARRNQKDILVEIPNEDMHKYWILNVDYKIIDALGQSREIACIQIDVENARRLGICYRDEKGVKQHPIIIHSAVSGGIERYLYMLFDDAEQPIPLWLSPIHLRLIPVSKKFQDACILYAKQNASQVRIDVDDRSESVSKRIHLAKQVHIPYIMVFGEKEEHDRSELERVLAEIRQAIENKPFLQLGWPVEVSKQV